MKIKRFPKRILYGAWRFFQRKIWGDYQRGGICGIYHWIRCHVWNRYHVINVTGMDGYKWGWIDRDRVLLLASFKIVCDFVEEELPQRSADEKLDAWELEVREIYDWWKGSFVERHKEFDEQLRVKKYKEYVDLDQKYENEADEMLVRLIKIRQYLWT